MSSRRVKGYTEDQIEELIYNRTANLEKEIQDFKARIIGLEEQIECFREDIVLIAQKHEKEIQGLTGMLVDRDETITSYRKSYTTNLGKIEGLRQALNIISSKGKRG